MTDKELRACWQNCSGLDDEVAAIDAMEDALGPLDEETVRIRGLITLFEACYHEADKEAEFIIGAIGAGRCPARSNERPVQRKRELQNAHDILAAWCGDPAVRGIDLDVDGIRADVMLNFIGEPNSLKLWQVERVVDRIRAALEPDCPYHNIALGVGEHGEPGTCGAEEYYRSDAAFLRRTRETMIHDTLDGQPSKVSLAYAIDLLMPCGWDFVGALVTILEAIGGDLYPVEPLALCARNIYLSPLYDRLTTISNTLAVFWKDQPTSDDIDPSLLAPLGAPTSVKRWLAASLDKTIRLHLTQPFPMDLF
jgi:hypothetical protein